MSKNAEGWIRHRGGKCPVNAGVMVEVRNRAGDVALTGGTNCTSVSWHWSHDKHGGDIMAYKIHGQAEETADEKVMRDCVEKCASTESVSQLMYDPIAQGPLQWRDRIAEIDAATQALTTERAELVQKLASEGFALIGRVGDMSDSKKWMVGDLFTVNGGDDHSFDVGDRVVLADDDGTSRLLFTKDGEESWVDTDCVKFHSRPSA